MRNIFPIKFLILVFIGILLCGDSAYPLESRQRQMGIFQPRIYGMNNNLEISTHPLLFFIKPNIKVKKFHGEYHGLGIASRLSIDYPTQLLKLIQREGTFGILAKDPTIENIPNLFVFQGELITTKNTDNYSITGKVGLSICPSCNLDSRHMVDLPLAYPRMAVYQYASSSNIGIDFDYIYSEKISLKTDVDLFLIPEEEIFLEEKLVINYQLSPKYTLSGGIKLTQGTYPFGKQLDIFPLIDLSWKWEK